MIISTPLLSLLSLVFNNLIEFIYSFQRYVYLIGRVKYHLPSDSSYYPDEINVLRSEIL